MPNRAIAAKYNGRGDFPLFHPPFLRQGVLWPWLYRSRTRWRGATPRLDVRRPLLGIFLGCRVRFGNPTRCLSEEPFQIAAAPAASGAGAETLAQLAGAARFFHPQKIHDLPLADVETEADFVVELHFRRVAFSSWF